MRERESQRKLRELERKSWVTELRELERNFWLRELREIVITVFFFFYVKIPCNFFNIIRVN